MKKPNKAPLFSINFNLLLILKRNENHCYWCGQTLRKCEGCGGKGMKSDTVCSQCNGNGALCKLHKIDWD